MILLQQLSTMVFNIKDGLTNGKAGTSDTLFVKTQTGLISPIADTEIALVDVSNTGSSIFATHQMDTTVGTGNTITELTIYYDTTELNRAVKAPFIKTEKNEYDIFHTFDFEVIA